MVYTLSFFPLQNDFKHGIYSQFFPSSKCSFIVFGSCIIHILYRGVLKLKKNNSGAKRLTFKNAAFCPQNIYMFCVYLRKKQ